jgi:hypothetical protein
MSFYIQQDGGLTLTTEQEAQALAQGAVGLGWSEAVPKDGVLLYPSTTGWTGVARNGERITRFRDFNRALRCAVRVSQARP